MDYTIFTEKNDWEGETWNFYFPYDKAQLVHLKKLIKKLNDGDDECDAAYTIGKKSIPEDAVDILVKYANTGSGYMDTHIKLGVPNFEDALKDYNVKDEDVLYKGGIKKYCAKASKKNKPKVESTKFPKTEVFIVSYRDIEKLPYHICEDMEIGNDSCLTYRDLNGKVDYSNDLNEFIESKGMSGSYIIETLMNDLIHRGKLDPGTYVIEICW